MMDGMSEISRASEKESLASTGLLSFYDRLRQRLTEGAQSRGGKAGRAASEVLLLAPDLFILLARLSLDPQVPTGARKFIIGATVYFLTPVDLLPEAIIGPAGYLEDVVLAAALLTVALGHDLEPMAERYWNGSRRLRVVLRDVADVAYNVLGENLYSRLQRLLARRGVKLG
jgi:uncharacterized membrane protein YkvA (DUF1232 family)